MASPTTVATGAIHEEFVRRATETPDAVALTHGPTSTTYAELNAASDHLAERLRSAGVTTESPVGLLSYRSARMLTGLLAVFKAGATAILLDPGHPQARLREVVDSIAPALVLTDPDVEFSHVRSVPLTYESSNAPVGVPVPLDCLAYLVLTSGSTGAPKPVAVTHRSIADATRIHREGYRLSARDRGSWLSPPGSSVSVGELWPFLSVGASVHVADQDVVSSPEALRDWLVAQRITVAYAGMPLAEALYTLPWPADCALRLLVVGSDTVRTWASTSLPFEVAVSIGSAEANAISSCLSPWGRRITSKTASRARQTTLPPVGRAWPGVRTHVLDGEFNPLPVGTIGELHVASSQLARGYLGDPRRTAAAFVPNPYAPGERLYRTGDLVRLGADGVLEHCGRVDGQVKIDGQRVVPAEVERHLLAHPDVTEAVVVARQDPSGRQRLVAYLAGGEVPAATMRGFVAGRLPVPSVPTAYVHLDTLPRNVNGKIDRRSLPDPRWQPDAPVDSQRDPQRGDGDEIDRAVVDSWRSALKLDRVAEDDDFYLVGGDSMAGNKIARDLNRRFGLRLTVRAVLLRPTPRQLAAAVRSAIGRRDA